MNQKTNAKAKNAISPTRSENYPEWYLEVVKAADLAENSPVRGSMVIRPWGYGIWENIRNVLDVMFKETGHENAYFPLLIPVSFLEKEAEHVEGFAKECAVVTHHRLQGDGSGKLVPAGELEEPFVIRPTSETIIGHMFAKWSRSYRDLPILINQWANVMRWEMRTRMFLRTAEFLWQEGHTVHATEKEAMEETLKMLDVYERFARDYLAIPVIKGEKTKNERFPGAVNTFTIEAMMQDGKALQAGTSHFLGQNFSKAQEIKFLGPNEKEEFAWTTSWGVSTRLIGGLIMTHSDDDGLVLPPKIAPAHIVIMPIFKNPEEEKTVLQYVENLAKELRAVSFNDGKVVVKVDNRDIRGGEKSWQHVKKGVPVRIEVGPRDVAGDNVFFARRDKDPKDKGTLPRAEFVAKIASILEEMQQNIYNKALEFRNKNTKKVNSLDELRSMFSGGDERINGFALCHFNECDEAINHPIMAELKLTIRCLPLEGEKEEGVCLFSGKPSHKRVIIAKSY